MKQQNQHLPMQSTAGLPGSGERLDWISKYLELADKMFQPRTSTVAKSKA